MGLVLFINGVATVTVPDTETSALSEALTTSPAASRPLGQATVTPIAFTDAGSEAVNPSGYDHIRQTVLGQLRLISLAGLFLIAVVGAVSAYWMAGRALRPLSEVSMAARRISATTLDTRLGLEAPEDEIKELAQSFDAMLDRLESSFAQQGQFVSNAAHELRTPLATLRTNLEVAYDDPAATLDDYREIAPVLDRTLTRLERLVADLLLMATEEKSLVYEELALQPLVEIAMQDLETVAIRQAVRLSFTAGGEFTVRGDGPLLARVFCNLIENAIRYNRPGGSVAVAVRGDPTEAIVEVTDTGIGITPEEQLHIFDRFYRSDRSRSRQRGGAGLGLAIVAHIVKLHGGQVLVESTPNTGSRFTVCLPCKTLGSLAPSTDLTRLSPNPS